MSWPVTKLVGFTGNRSEGRTDAKIHDLRRKIAEHDLLIEKNDALRT